MNQHLKGLKVAGLITGYTEGVRTKFCINPEKIDEFRESLQSFFDSFDTVCGQLWRRIGGGVWAGIKWCAYTKTSIWMHSIERLIIILATL